MPGASKRLDLLGGWLAGRISFIPRTALIRVDTGSFPSRQEKPDYPPYRYKPSSPTLNRATPARENAPMSMGFPLYNTLISWALPRVTLKVGSPCSDTVCPPLARPL